MKKARLFLTALLLVCLLLCGCGKAEVAAPETPSAPIAQSEPTAPAAAPEDPPAAAPAAEAPEAAPVPVETAPLVEYGEPGIHQWVELNEAEPNFQIMVPVTNVSADYLSLRNASYTLKDADANKVYVFECADCAPIYLAPGQSGIMYYTSIERDGVDYRALADTLEYDAEFFAMDEGTVVPLPVENVQFAKNLGSIEITGDLVNDTEYDFDQPYVSFLFRNEDGDILSGAFCMGGNSDFNSEDFGKQPAGTTMPFTSYRYWLPDDYPIEKASIEAFGFGLHY